jgi:hypothetical protein
MSKIALSGNASGTGTFAFAAPGTNTDRTLTLPDATGTVVLTDATQTLTNKTIQGGTITLGTAVASTSGTAIDFTGIPSWAKRVTVMFRGVSTNGTSDHILQIGSGSITTTGYNSINQQGAAVSSSSSGFILSQGGTVGAANFMSGNITINLVSGNTYAASAVIAVPNVCVFQSGGGVSLSGALDRIRITTVNGTDTFDAGTINISYEG